MKNYLFTSESVTEGHPDKICDKISDAILDEILRHDPESRVACETMITTARVVVSAEITTKAKVDYHQVIRNTLEEIGYSKEDLGAADFSGSGEKEIFIETFMKEQSPHIAQGVNSNDNHEQGAGDQGLMFGYACTETPELMPMPIQLSHELAEQLANVRKNGNLKWLKPDGKTQVTIEYNQNNEPVKIAKVVIATQHKDMLDQFNDEKEEHKFISNQIIKEVILPVLNKNNVEYDENFIINGTGRFVKGGPIADVGLTGRKIIVDTYGGYAKHGGGAFSGKDPSKVDRSAAYMARYVAKNIVAAKLATKCEVQLSYCIGLAMPISINVNTFNTSKFSDSDIESAINQVFDFRPAQIIKHLDLKRPIYKELACYGHFGRGEKYTWEKTDKANKLVEILI